MRLALALSLGLFAALATSSSTEAKPKSKMSYGEKVSAKISLHIRGTHYCQMKMDRPRTKVRLLFTRQSVQRRRYVLRVWIDRHDDTCDAYRKMRLSFG